LERRDDPPFSFRCFGPPPGREGGSLIVVTVVVFMEIFGRKGGLDCANPTFDQMAQHYFYCFGTNPSAESFVRSRACF
jgi:hypothetical protein